MPYLVQTGVRSRYDALGAQAVAKADPLERMQLAWVPTTSHHPSSFTSGNRAAKARKPLPEPERHELHLEDLGEGVFAEAIRPENGTPRTRRDKAWEEPSIGEKRGTRLLRHIAWLGHWAGQCIAPSAQPQRPTCYGALTLFSSRVGAPMGKGRATYRLRKLCPARN
jgi:hypothetical protein